MRSEIVSNVISVYFAFAVMFCARGQDGTNDNSSSKARLSAKERFQPCSLRWEAYKKQADTRMKGGTVSIVLYVAFAAITPKS